MLKTLGALHAPSSVVATQDPYVVGCQPSGSWTGVCTFLHAHFSKKIRKTIPHIFEAGS